MASRHKLVFVRRARAMFEFITDYLWQNKTLASIIGFHYTSLSIAGRIAPRHGTKRALPLDSSRHVFETLFFTLSCFAVSLVIAADDTPLAHRSSPNFTES
jgi:hypothetical protein